MKYLLTVVIPTYNRAQDLEECLSYVIPQVLPYKNKVHIYISDNASTDNTKDVIKELITEYSDIITYYCQKENLTASPNYNDAVHRVDSEYVYMLSDDDFIVPECITFMLRCIEEYPDVEYFYLNQYLADTDMHRVRLYTDKIGKDYVKVYESGGDLIREHFNGPSCISSNMFKRHVWIDAAKDMKQDCPGYVWLSIVFQGIIDKKSAFIRYPMFTARAPRVVRYSANWPWYYVKGLGQLFKYLDPKSPGIYNDWIKYQQKDNWRVFVSTLVSVSKYKKQYKERKCDMMENIVSYNNKILYFLLVTIIPEWFAIKILQNIIRLTKLFRYI